MKILFTGGRYFSNKACVERLCDRLIRNGGEVIVGDALGADALVREYCHKYKIPYTLVSADWSKGKIAGPIRNQQMIDMGPDLCIAFPGGAGTNDCTTRAHAAGIPVLRVEP